MAAREEDSPLHERITAVLGRQTYRAVAETTGHNAETVRRYLQGQAPSVEFLSALCAHYDVSAQWLLTGQGPMRQSQTRAHALSAANPAELLAAIAAALEKLTHRVDRIELFVHTMETRLRARPLAAAQPAPLESDRESAVSAQATPGQPGGVPAVAAPDTARARALSVADALAQRSRTSDR
ncbi:MAG: helix-turn-helix transcriptional regulator [Planctomycetota bacterium]|nr:helix-turn-helix transcriptional regulator [Planctomycetota bacterium]